MILFIFRQFSWEATGLVILPPRHTVTALNKVFTLGTGLGDVVFELAALAILSVLYFGLGVWLFRKMHLN